MKQKDVLKLLDNEMSEVHKYTKHYLLIAEEGVAFFATNEGV